MLRALPKILFLLFLIITFSGCKRTDYIVVPDNTAPPDNTVKSFNRDAYINRVYISMMGRKATDSEKILAESMIPETSPTSTQLNTFIDALMTQPSYIARTYDNARLDYLQNLDTAEIGNMLQTFQQILNSTTDPFLIDQIQREITRLNELRAVPVELLNGSLTRSEMHKRCVNNWFYDQINMGTANFVISSFQNFLFRYPTAFELENGISMVDGASGTLFLNTGNSKTDYLSIFFSSLAYSEGQVIVAFRRYLFREPTANELSSLSVQLHQTWSFTNLEKHILTSTEYAYQ